MGQGNCVFLVSGACEPCQDGKGTSGMVSFMSYGVGPSARSFKQRSDCLTVAVPEHLVALFWNHPRLYWYCIIFLHTQPQDSLSILSSSPSTQTKEHIHFHLVAFRNSASLAMFWVTCSIMALFWCCGQIVYGLIRLSCQDIHKYLFIVRKCLILTRMRLLDLICNINTHRNPSALP